MSPTPHPLPDRDEPATGLSHPIVKWIGIFALGSFALGLGTAGFENLADGPGDSIADWAIALVGSVGLVLSILLGWRMVKASAAQKISKSERGSNRLLILSGLLGGALSLAMIVGTRFFGGSFELFSNAPLPPQVAAIIIPAWLILMPWLTIAWYKTVDEHERETYITGAMIGLHAYAVLVPAWWIGWRGGFLAEPNHMLIYLGVILIWGLAWLWQRLR